MILALGIVDSAEKLLVANLGIFLAQLVQNNLCLFEHSHVRCALRLSKAEAGDLSPVHQCQRPLFGIHVADFSQVSQLDRATARNGDLRLSQGIGAGGVAEHADRLFSPGDFSAAASGIDVHLLQLLIDLAGRYATRLHLCRIQYDADFPADAPAPRDSRHARHRQQPFGHRVVDIPGQFLQRHVGGFRAEIGHRCAVKVEAGDLRLQYSFGKIAANLVDGVLDVGDGAIDRRSDLELDCRNGLSFRHDRSDFIDAADATHGSFDALSHLGFEFGWRGAGLKHHHLRHGKADVRLLIDVHPHEADHARQQ